MTLELTKKQAAIVTFIKEFTSANNYSPSYREIMNGLGLSSVSAVAEHIENLVAKGIIKKIPGAARSLEIVESTPSETQNLFRTKLSTVSPEEKQILLAAAKILEVEL